MLLSWVSSHACSCTQEGAEEALSLLKRVTVAVTPANDDLRKALRSLAGTIGSQAAALSTGSLVDALSLLGTWRLLSENTALNLVTTILSRFERDQADDVFVSTCAAAMVVLRGNFEGTDADRVAQASANKAGVPRC